MKNKKAELNPGAIAIIVILLILVIVFGWFSFTGGFAGVKDSDNDGLSDDKEASMGTDPNNPNTDGDRYLDGEDKQPLKKNSAYVTTELVNKEWNWGSIIANAFTLITKIGKADSNSVIADTKVQIKIKNTGDDYTEYINYKLVYEVSGNELRSKSYSVGRLNPGEEKVFIHEDEIYMKDLPDLLYNSIMNWNTNWNIKVENLNYERF